MADRKRTLAEWRENPAFDRIWLIQAIIGGIVGLIVAYLSEDFFGDNNPVDAIVIGIVAFVIVEAILIETEVIGKNELVLFRFFKKKEE